MKRIAKAFQHPSKDSIDMANFNELVDATVPATLFALDKLDYGDIFKLADEWLNKGVYLESLNYIFMESICSDLEFSNPCKNYNEADLFRQALGELGVDIPKRDDAILLLIKHKIHEILSGDIEVIAGASYIYYDIHLEYRKHFKKEKYIGECMGLGEVFCWLRELWDCREGDRLTYHSHMSRDEAEDDIIELLKKSLELWLQTDIKLSRRGKSS